MATDMEADDYQSAMKLLETNELECAPAHRHKEKYTVPTQEEEILQLFEEKGDSNAEIVAKAIKPSTKSTIESLRVPELQTPILADSPHIVTPPPSTRTLSRQPRLNADSETEKPESKNEHILDKQELQEDLSRYSNENKQRILDTIRRKQVQIRSMQAHTARLRNEIRELEDELDVQFQAENPSRVESAENSRPHSATKLGADIWDTVKHEGVDAKNWMTKGVSKLLQSHA